MRPPSFWVVVLASCGFLILMSAHATDNAAADISGVTSVNSLKPHISNRVPLHPLSGDQNIGCDCYSVPECFTNCSFVPQIRPRLLGSREFLQTLPTPFGVTMLQQLRRKRLKYDTSTASKWSYFQQAQFRLSLLGSEKAIQIKLKKSSVFSADGDYSTLFYRSRNGIVSEVEFTRPEDCFYTGEVETAPNTSYAAVDTCSGLRGAIFYQNVTYVIFPLPCPSCEPQTAPHLILPWQATPVARNASMRTFWKPVDLMAMLQTSLERGVSAATDTLHTLWLEFIVDENLLREFGDNFTTTIRYTASVVNLVNFHFRDLPIRIHLLRTQVWNLGNRMPVERSIKATLNGIQRYRSEQGSVSSRVEGALRRHKRNPQDLDDSGPPQPSPGAFKHVEYRKSDITLFLTSSTEIEFVEGVDYIAVPGSICTPRGTAVVRVNLTDFEFHVARLVSKSIAEILGILSFPCPEMYSCDDREVFSRGDLSRLRLALLSGISACLRSASVEERESLTIDTCGNGVVDRGEECEPHQHGITVNFQPGGTGSGIVNGSVSSSTGCCDPKTCLADVHAVCVDGACCRGCQLVSRGRLCRPARDQCDLPEFCSGLEPNCPSDLYLENGMPCRVDAKTSEESTAAASVGAEERENALCYEGRCPTRSSHCKALWGPSARTADEFCYTSLNKNIDSACGEGVICEDENTMCGLLHCRDGTDEPLPVEARSLSFFNLRTQHDRQKIQCQRQNLHVGHAPY
uniref:Disintegrin domain-containing protein n=1 Tax=Mesocestoides corti TaxID=53468 RepID=A0A5K3ETV4_MESCO